MGPKSPSGGGTKKIGATSSGVRSKVESHPTLRNTRLEQPGAEVIEFQGRTAILADRGTMMFRYGWLVARSSSTDR